MLERERQKQADRETDTGSWGWQNIVGGGGAPEWVDRRFWRQQFIDERTQRARA